MLCLCSIGASVEIACLVEVPSWRNGVNFTKIGKVPNEHPSYLMCMVNQNGKENIELFTEIKYLLSLTTKMRLGNLKANSNYDARKGRSGWQARI